MTSNTDTGAAKVLVRWMDETTADCFRDDGVRSESCLDFARMSGVFVTSSVEYAKQIIVDCLINDELISLYDERGTDDNDHEVPAMRDEFTWEQSTENATEWWCHFRGDLVAGAYISPLDVLEPVGGPT